MAARKKVAKKAAKKTVKKAAKKAAVDFLSKPAKPFDKMTLKDWQTEHRRRDQLTKKMLMGMKASRVPISANMRSVVFDKAAYNLTKDERKAEAKKRAMSLKKSPTDKRKAGAKKRAMSLKKTTKKKK